MKKAEKKLRQKLSAKKFASEHPNYHREYHKEYNRTHKKAPYSDSRPVEWRNYYQRYVVKYRSDPFNKTKINMNNLINRWIHAGLMEKPRCCALCKTPTREKLYCHFSDAFVAKMLKRGKRIDASLIKPHARFLCRKHNYAKRTERSRKK